MSKHGRMICKNCGTTVAQCRCPNHTAVYEAEQPCDNCQGLSPMANGGLGHGFNQPKPLVTSQLMEIINRIDYKRGWEHHVLSGYGSKGDGWSYQCVFSAKCTTTGQTTKQKSRKWYLSPWACKSEIVRTVYKAIREAELHELDENFKYKNAAIYDPHRDVDELATIKKIDARRPR